MAQITVNFTGASGDGAPVDPFDLEEIIKKGDIDKIIVIGQPPENAQKALADLAKMGHTVEYITN
jgi:hypothetical protein